MLAAPQACNQAAGALCKATAAAIAPCSEKVKVKKMRPSVLLSRGALLNT